MSERSKIETMPIDEAFRFAIIQAWDDLAKVTPSRSVNVEYLCEPGAPLDHVSVWLAKAGGYQDLVCDYWMWTSSAHPSGARFGNRHHSDKLGQTLDFVMKNQGRFTRPVDACRDGLVRVFPSGGDDRSEAATRLRGVQVLESEGGAGEPSEPPSDQRRDEEAWSRMNDEGDPNELAVALPNATGHSG